MSSSEIKQRRIKCLRVSWLMHFVLIFCADNNERDVWLLFMLLFGESALRPVRDDDEEEDEDEDEVENE